MRKKMTSAEVWANAEIKRLNLEVERLSEKVVGLQNDLRIVSNHASNMSNTVSDYANKMNSLAHYILDHPTSNTEEAKGYANDILDFIIPKLESE